MSVKGFYNELESISERLNIYEILEKIYGELDEMNNTFHNFLEMLGINARFCDNCSKSTLSNPCFFCGSEKGEDD